MITKFQINYFQDIENLTFDFTETGSINPENAKYYEQNNNLNIYRSIVFHGPSIVGKTTLFNCIQYMSEVAKGGQIYQDASMDIEFISNNNIYKYCIIADNKTKQFTDQIYVNSKLQKQKRNTIIQQVVKPWFQKLVFIESSYEDSNSKCKDDLIKEIEENRGSIGPLLKKYASDVYVCKYIDYDTFILYKEHISMILKTPEKMISLRDLPKSTLELLTLLPTIDKFVKNNGQILIVDDFLFIAKQKLFKILKQKFMEKLESMGQRQLIVFTDEFDKSNFNDYSKSINLETSWPHPTNLL